jgi:hypothetical protein
MAGNTKKWTFMVYLAGDNNLDASGVGDLDEMKEVGSTRDINVIAQFDRAGALGETRRYYIRKSGSIEDDALQSLGETNTGDPATLLDFIKWGIAGYPAERYALVLWNHGQGWDDTDIYGGSKFRAIHRLARGRIRHSLFRTSVHSTLAAAARPGVARAILLDDDAKDFLDNLEMKQVLAAVRKLLHRKLDVLGMDACLMSMAEVCYQVRGSVQFTVGSEETEPGEGWPYAQVLGGLAGKPGMAGEEFSALIVDEYLKSYGANDGVTQSACRLTHTPALAGAVSGLAKALVPALDKEDLAQQIAGARTRSQEYYIPDNIDLVSFCQELKAREVTEAIRKACQRAIDVAADMVVRSGYKGKKMARSNGLAIYFPTRAVSPLYARLDFTSRTGWGKFLDKYLQATLG